MQHLRIPLIVCHIGASRKVHLRRAPLCTNTPLFSWLCPDASRSDECTCAVSQRGTTLGTNKPGYKVSLIPIRDLNLAGIRTDLPSEDPPVNLETYMERRN